jgi:uncharacterized protein (DUF433 family)
MFTVAIGSYAICAICGWEDDAVQLANPCSGGGANKESLAECQRRSATWSEEHMRRYERDPHWRPLTDTEIEYFTRVAKNKRWANQALDRIPPAGRDRSAHRLGPFPVLAVSPALKWFLNPMEERIVIDPSVCNGRPTVRGTRITVQTVLEFLGAGDSVDDVLEEYPSLTKDDILACIRYSSQLMGHHFVIEKVG